MLIRHLEEEDYPTIMAVIDQWWDGRPMAAMLPKLFFQHFVDTSFAIVDGDTVVAFLVGLVSAVHPLEAYIHFVGVHPEYRQRGLARKLYEEFIATVRNRGCREVHCVTSPGNRGSIAFHLHMGFQCQDGDAIVEGIPVTRNYDGRGNSRVRFVLRVAPKSAQEEPCSTVLRIAEPPPYYAVIFSSSLSANDQEGYVQAARDMETLARNQPGFLGLESVRSIDGLGITVSYWTSLESIQKWREQTRHREVQLTGRTVWYDAFSVRVARVDRAYGYPL